MRRAAKVDASQPGIVDALEDAGYRVEIIGLPVDLAVLIPRTTGVFQMLECKTLTKSGKVPKDKRQQDQQQFLEETGTPIVGTPQQALDVMARHGSM